MERMSAELLHPWNSSGAIPHWAAALGWNAGCSCRVGEHLEKGKDTHRERDGDLLRTAGRSDPRPRRSARKTCHYHVKLLAAHA